MQSPPPSTADPDCPTFSLPPDTDPDQFRLASPVDYNSYAEETPVELPLSIKKDGCPSKPSPANIIESDYMESQWPSVLFVGSDSQMPLTWGTGEWSPLSLGDLVTSSGKGKLNYRLTKQLLESHDEQPTMVNQQRSFSVWTEEKRWLLQKVNPKFVPMLLEKCGNEAATKTRINRCPRREKE